MDDIESAIKKIVYGILIGEYGKILTQPRCEELSIMMRESILDFLAHKLPHLTLNNVMRLDQ